MAETQGQAPTPPDPYQKPELPFFQQEFDGHQPEVSEEDRAYVESAFARLVDGVHDRAEEDSTMPRYSMEAEGYGDPDAIDTTVDLTGPDGRFIEVSVIKDTGQKVLDRSINIHWYGEEDSGTTTYRIPYVRAGGAVCRDDDSGMIAPGNGSIAERNGQKVASWIEQRDLGLNDQPIGKKEMDGLAVYIEGAH